MCLLYFSFSWMHFVLFLSTFSFYILWPGVQQFVTTLTLGGFIINWRDPDHTTPRPFVYVLYLPPSPFLLFFRPDGQTWLMQNENNASTSAGPTQTKRIYCREWRVQHRVRQIISNWSCSIAKFDWRKCFVFTGCPGDGIIATPSASSKGTPYIWMSRLFFLERQGADLFLVQIHKPGEYRRVFVKYAKTTYD